MQHTAGELQLRELIDTDDYLGTREYAQRNRKLLTPEQIRDLSQYWFDIGEIDQCRKLITSLLHDRIKLRRVNELEEIVLNAKGYKVDSMLYCESLILSENWNELMEHYEDMYHDFFLRGLIRSEQLSKVSVVRKKYQDLYQDYRFAFFCCEIEMLEDIDLYLRTKIAIPIESRMKKLAILVVGATMYPWFYLTVLFYVFSSERKDFASQFLRNKEFLKVIKDISHKNRLAAYLMELMGHNRKSLEANQGQNINEEQVDYYAIDYGLIENASTALKYYNDQKKSIKNFQVKESDLLLFENVDMKNAHDFFMIDESCSEEGLEKYCDYLKAMINKDRIDEVLDHLEIAMKKVNEEVLYVLIYLEGEIYDHIGLSNQAKRCYQKVYFLNPQYKKCSVRRL